MQRSLGLLRARPRGTYQRCAVPYLAMTPIGHSNPDADRIVPADQLSSLSEEKKAPTHPDDKVVSSVFVLPNDHKTITDSAREIFSVIAPTHTLFARGR